MLALAADLAPLDTGERFALDLLLDLACVLRVESAATPDIVRLRVAGAADAAALPTLRARG